MLASPSCGLLRSILCRSCVHSYVNPGTLNSAGTIVKASCPRRKLELQASRSRAICSSVALLENGAATGPLQAGSPQWHDELQQAYNKGCTLCGGSPPSVEQLRAVEEQLGYTFNDLWMLRLALMHPSVGRVSNNRLAWVGDAVLSYAMSRHLYRTHKDAQPGRLSGMRIDMASQSTLWNKAQSLGWEKLAVIDRSYFMNLPSNHNRMLAETFEAVFGAVYDDSGCNSEAISFVFNRLFVTRSEDGATTVCA